MRLIPFHICGKPPSYFIVAGLVFTRVTVPYLRSEYGKEYDFDAPVKLLDKMMHAMAEQPGQQVTVLSQVLASDVNIGYEEIINTQVGTQMAGAGWGCAVAHASGYAAAGSTHVLLCSQSQWLSTCPRLSSFSWQCKQRSPCCTCLVAVRS